MFLLRFFDNPFEGIPVGEIMRFIWPFYGGLIVAPMRDTHVPAFSLWRPGLVLGK